MMWRSTVGVLGGCILAGVVCDLPLWDHTRWNEEDWRVECPRHCRQLETGSGLAVRLLDGKLLRQEPGGFSRTV